MDTVLSPELVQWERVAAIIEDVTKSPRPFTSQEFAAEFGKHFPEKKSRDLLNEHFCICGDGFIRIRSLSKSLQWLEENVTA